MLIILSGEFDHLQTLLELNAVLNTALPSSKMKYPWHKKVEKSLLSNIKATKTY